MKKRIVCFGDSNTWGYDAFTDGRFDEDTRWTGVLEKNLGAEYTIIEEGLCGRTTVFEDPLNEGLKGLDYLHPCLMTHNPIDLLIIMLGTNDCKERFSATPKNIAGGIRRLIVKAKQTPAWRSAPNILVIAPGPMDIECETAVFGADMGICSKKSELLVKEIEDCAKEQGCGYLNAGLYVRMNKVDYMHLDRDSHTILAEKIEDYIRNYEF